MLTRNLLYLEELVECGIGTHHAGMTLDDRRVIEDLFLQKLLRVIVATSVSFLFALRYLLIIFTDTGRRR